MSEIEIASGEAALTDDPRTALAEGLSAYLTRPQIDALLNEALALKKKAWVTCSCGKRAEVEISDAKAVVAAVADLMIQGFGRPSEAKHEREVVVQRSVTLTCSEGHACPECASEGVAMATVAEARRDILVTRVPELEIRRLDDVARTLDTSRSALLRRVIRALAASAQPAPGGEPS